MLRRLPFGVVFLVLVGWMWGVAPRRAWAQGEAPIWSGPVTVVGTGTRYSVAGRPVACTPGVTATGVANALLRTNCAPLKFGETVQVFGTNKKAEIAATRVEGAALGTVPVAGFALVDRVLDRVGDEQARVRADGYVLSIGPTSTLRFGKGAPADAAALTTNVWVRYEGRLEPGGIVVVERAEFTPNVVPPREDRLRTATDFDPTTVTEEDRQSGLRRAFRGVNGRQLPATTDAALQARVERIGTMLVPAFQRQLPVTDPTKVNFRFQVVHDERLRVMVMEPSGVIQIPEQFFDRLENDSQVAALLSVAVAVVMEKQEVRAAPVKERVGAMEFAGEAAGLVVPGLGLATGIASAKAASVIEHRQEEQSSRTGLSWMQDAGFDLREAPVTWWRLADRKGKGLEKTEMPYRTQYLYTVLWREGR